MAIDPTFANVGLLLSFDGANAATTFTDHSTSAKIGTAVGNAQLDTSVSKFGSASLKLDGSGDYVTYADSDDWAFGTGPFTIDLHVRFAATPTKAVLLCQWSGGWAFYFEGGQLFMRVDPANDSTKYTWSPALNTWYQIRCERDASNVLRIYVDGVMVAKTTGFNYNVPNASSVLCIGSLVPGGFSGYDLNGHVDNVRIKKGNAECGSDAGFTPPVAAWPVNDIHFANVLLLTNFNGANGATTAPDDSSYAKTLTFNGNAQLSNGTLTPWGDASLIVDGTGDYVTVPDDTSWHLGSGSFTVEAHLRWFADPNAFQFLFGQWQSSGNLRGWSIDYDGAGNLLRLTLSTAGSVTIAKVTASFTPTLSVWYHVAATFDGTTYRLFIDGALVGSATTAVTIFDTTSSFSMGCQPDATFPFNGRISELRITKGIARYVAAFSKPTTSFPRNIATDLTSISPSSGANTGGVAVTLTGSGFTGATGVNFNGVAATSFTVVNDTTITCTTPASISGSLPVKILHPSGDATFYDLYTATSPSSDLRTTQLPVIVLDLSSRSSRVTQAPLLVLNLPGQPSRATQVVSLPLWMPKPLPTPSPIVPEVPVTEIWEWKTVVNILEKGVEQRSALRAHPRVGMNFSAIILDDADRREVYQMLFSYISKIFTYPLYSHSTKLITGSLAGTLKLFFDPASTDMRAGEAIALFDPTLSKTQQALISSVDVDGVTLAAPLTSDVPSHWWVAPAPEFHTKPIVGLQMDSVSGSFTLQLEGASQRPVLRPGQSSGLLTTIDGLLVLDKRPLANNDVDEQMNQDMVWLDNGINRPEGKTLWPVPYINGSRDYLLHRPADLDYWRAVGNYLKGRQKAFLLPTFRDDLPLAAVPAPGATVIVSSNISFFAFWRSKAYRYIRIQSQAGVIYRRILEVTANYDSVTGDPVTISITLSNSIGAGAGANQISAVSFCNTARLDSDEIVLEHGYVDTVLSIKVRTVEE